MAEPARGEDRVIGVANVEMAKAWEEEGARWAEQAERYDATVRRHSRRLLEAARISADDRVLDIGCGCGETTRDAARFAASGLVLGVDLSARMIEWARERARAEGLTNVRFEQADAQVYPFEREGFDLAISRFGAMFFADPVAAFRNIGRALRPGGRAAKGGSRFRWVVLRWATLCPDEGGRRRACGVIGARANGSPRPDGTGPDGSSIAAWGVADGSPRGPARPSAATGSPMR